MVIYERMVQDGVEPDAFAYSVMIRAYSETSGWEKGMEVFEDLGRSGLEPELVTYNNMLRAFAAGPPEQAEKLLKKCVFLFDEVWACSTCPPALRPSGLLEVLEVRSHLHPPPSPGTPTSADR